MCITKMHYHLVSADPMASCVEEFITDNSLVTRSRQIGGLRYFHGQQLLFPNISFSVGGILTKWTFAAVGQLGSVTRVGRRQVQGDLQYPELQIWKRETSTTNNYIKRMSFGGSTEPSKVPGTLNVYEYSTDSAIPFEVNDILGIYQPNATNSTLSLGFLSDFGTPTHICNSTGNQPQSQCILSDTGDFTALPLVAVEVTSASKSCSPHTN